MNKKYTKKFLIKELAKRAEFSASDVMILWNTFEDFVEEIVKNGDELMVGGLFKIYAKEMKPHRAYDINTKETKTVGNRYRLVISTSTNLRRVLREMNSKKILDPPDKEE